MGFSVRTSRVRVAGFGCAIQGLRIKVPGFGSRYLRPLHWTEERTRFLIGHEGSGFRVQD